MSKVESKSYSITYSRTGIRIGGGWYDVHVGPYNLGQVYRNKTIWQAILPNDTTKQGEFPTRSAAVEWLRKQSVG